MKKISVLFQASTHTRNKTLKQPETVLAFAHPTRKLCYRKDDRAMRAIKVDRELLRRYGLLKFFQDGGGRHLGFVRTVNTAV